MRTLVVFLVTALVGLATSGASAQKKPVAPAKPEKFDAATRINTPRPDARKIAFDTSEGTWMSVDVAPDGKTIVFDMLGDLYAIPIAGGTAKALTRGPALDSTPHFSPDGKTIAFTSDENGIDNIWLIDVDGTNRRPLTEIKDAYVRGPVWTPDGQYLIARKEDAKRGGIPPVELWMFHRLGGSGIKLTSSDKIHSSSGPVVSKDGRYIYFSARRPRFNYVPDMSQGLWQVMRYDRQTSDVVPISTGFGGAVRPALSPDGRTLTFLSRRDATTVMVARDLETGAERIIASGLVRDEQEGFAQADLWPGYAFMPDGQSLLLYHHGKLGRLDPATQSIADVPFTASVEQSIAPTIAWQEKTESGPVTARILRWPNQAPSGRWITFDAFGRVWLQEIASGKAVGTPRRLTAGAEAPREYAPTFSPDGKWIAFVTWSDTESGHLWKMAVSEDGSPVGAPVQVTRRPGHYANPSWSLKGDRIALVRGSGLELRGQQPEEESFFEIHWVDAAGGDLQHVTTVELANSMRFHPQAFWSADASRLYFRDPVEQQKPEDPPLNDLVSIRLDGTDRKAHLRVPPVDNLVPSPDERWVAFTSRDNVYVTALPPLQTASPPEVSLKEGSVPVWRLSDAAGGYVSWADSGRMVTWALGNSFHRLPLNAAIDFVEQQKRRQLERQRQAEAKDAAAPAKTDSEPTVPASEAIQLTLTMPRAVPQGSFVLQGARVLTMNAKDEALENVDVLVTGNRIAGIGPTGTIATPAGAKVFDARGKTIMPGIVDTHAHLHYSGFEIFPETKWEYVANLAYGVTTVYDPSAPSLDVFAQAEMVEAGTMLGPRVYSSGDVLYGGQQAAVFAEVTSLDDARRQVKRMKAYGARMIKVYQQARRDQRIWFGEAARELKMLVTAEGAGELWADLTMVTDGYTAFEHSLPVAVYRDVAELVAKSGTYYTPTLVVSYGGPTAEFYFWQTRNPHDDPKLNRFVPHRLFDVLGRRRMWIPPDEYQFPNVAAGAAAIVNAGGKVTLGAHGQLQGLGAHWELWALAGEGQPEGRSALTPMQALRAATIASAEKIGFGPDLGSIEIGKLADLVVLDADPLTDIHNTTKIRWVVKNGTVFDAESMGQEWPEQKPLPPFFWRQRNQTTESR